ncbi:PQQ-binding-like beta-propeller repeat protein [Pontibacter sp. G13]|uniref:outer membrane protein assembly factor BamB family protein n=1 Tax=Pontibacter sp. G13 TaxID=3074898 RepID=UPI00288AFF20|nr:PQQ-binding-like beta-propeller repeat protein [Pontibacter sp. G13]WNJ21617.1 PQQ-binding-like beta-propeller repeat protein [Pontibacter sp. G13]
MRAFLFASLPLLLACSSCQSEPESQPRPLPELVWTRPFLENRHLVSTRTPVLSSKGVIYSPREVSERTNRLRSYGKQTGDLRWEFTDFHPAATYSLIDRTTLHQTGEILALTIGPVRMGLNIETGQKVWEASEFDNSNPLNQTFGNHFIQTHTTTYPQRNPDYHLGLYDGNTGEGDIIYHSYGDSIWRNGIDFPLLDVHASGDTILYVAGYSYRPDSILAFPSLKAINLTQDTLMFAHTSQSLPGLDQGALYLVNGKLILAGSQLRAFDPETGAQLWFRDESTSGRFCHVVGNHLLTYTGYQGETLSRIDLETGNVIWRTEAQGELFESRIEIYEGTVYLTGWQKLYAFDLLDGSKHWEISSPHQRTDSDAYFADVLAIDQETGRIYLSDYRYALCFQL